MAVIAREYDPGIRTLMTQSSRRAPSGAADSKIPRKKPIYPISAERELARVYLSIANGIIKMSKPYIDRIAAVYGVWADENVRVDARISIQDGISEIMEEYGDAMSAGMDFGEISKLTERAAKVARGASLRDWRATVKDSLDLMIDTPFYEETTEDLVTKFVYENVSYIQSYPQELLGKIQEVIEWGYNTHQPLVNVYRRLEKITGDTRAHVRMVARDQMGTLTCQLTRKEHESLGVTHYIWVTRRDNRVRECHRELDGKMFSWDNPPAMWYETKSRGIVYTGRYCHPGQDYCCRCMAKPVFDPNAVTAAIARGSVR